MTTGAIGVCKKCGQRGYIMPLHGDKGGPLFCPFCIGNWYGEYGKKLKWRRIVVRALKAYEAAGGKLWDDLEEMRLAASGLSVSSLDANYVPSEVGDITSELLADILQLTHPDKHSAQRELAHRVTAELLALKPFVFPAPQPDEPPPDERSGDALSKTSLDEISKLSKSYPCELCADTLPRDYCQACKAEWDRRQEEEREREEKKRLERNARQRQLYAEDKRRPRMTVCQNCAGEFLAKRQDAKYCSASCRQKAYLRRDGKPSNTKPVASQEIERAIEAAFAAEPNNAFTVEDLCKRVYPNPNNYEWERKQKVAVMTAAKRVVARKPLGEGWDWWRGNRPGRCLVFWNCASVMSYAMARLKSDWLEGGWPEEKLKGLLAGTEPHGYDYPKWIAEGGAWWRHWKLNVMEAKGETETEDYRKLCEAQDDWRS